MSSESCRRSTEFWGRRRRTLFLFLLVAAGSMLSAGSALAQNTARITGSVTDASSGAPLSDVQVYLVGQGIGANSRQTGQYLILNVPAGSYEIRAERIGLSTVSRQITVAAGANMTENFQLTSQALNLDEIVVTGTAGAATRREVGNSITTINAADLPDRPTNVMDLLTGMAPGVDVVPQAGGETGQGSNITIRGVNSINNSGNPIIVIDGIRIMSNKLPSVAGNTPSPLDQINPNDIERIEVISGPAASTLYGTEATSGVIQVFTKRGSQRAAVWTVDMQQGTMWTTKFGMNGIDYLHMDPWICTKPFGGCGEFQSIPHTQLNSLSVRGGGQALQYFMSAGYDSERGATPEEHLERWNGRANFTVTPVEDVTVQFNAAYTNTAQQNGGTGNSTTGLTLNVFRDGQGYLASRDPQVLNQLLDIERKRTIERLTTGGTITYSPIANLTNRVTIGYDLTQQEGRTITPFGFIIDPEGSISVSVYTRRFLTFDYVGTYTANLDRLRSSFSWGGQATGDFQATVGSSGTGFPGSTLPTVNSAASTLGTESRRKIWNSGFFFQNVFDLNAKYFLTLGLRVDGNSTFGKNFNLQMYPKASAVWIAHDEAFWNPAWGELKLRAAWGKSGRAPDAFIAQRTWTNSGLAGESAFTPGNLGNPDIGPEVTSEIELGFDAAYLDGKVRPRYTYYHQRTDDAIQSLSTIPSLGFTSSVNFNVGSVANWGHEVGLAISALQKRNWGWEIDASFSHNQNKVLSWLGVDDPALDVDDNGDPRDRVGNPVDRTSWTMYHNGEGMGTSYSATSRTYTTQGCEVEVTNADGTVTEVPRPGLDPSIHACSYSSVKAFGYSMPRVSTIINGATSFRLPYGIALSVRGDWRGGGSWLSSNPIPIGRNVISPFCMPWYVDPTVDNRIRNDAPGIWVRRCVDGTGASYQVPRDELRIHTISATLPMDFAFPDRVQSATLTLVWGNVLWHNQTQWGRYPRTGSVSEVGERVPTQSTLNASLRVTF